MAWENETITEMGLLSQMVYLEFDKNPLIKNELINKFTYDDVTYNLGTTYQVIDYTPNSDWLSFGFQALLLQDTTTGNYVIAFRGTELSTYGDNATNIQMFLSTFINTLPTTFGEALQVIDPMIEKYGLNSGNTSIVGHSMGGSLAQYFGASTGFETLTYNAYGVSGMDMVPSSSGENITNYITMHDPVSILPGSEMVGKTYMLQDETLLSVAGHGIANFTSDSNWVRGYSRVNSPDDIDVIWGDPNDDFRIHANINGTLNDIIIGGEINNTLIGGGGKDTLYGMGGSDTLNGGAGNDILVGGYSDKIDAFADQLLGGKGFDTYISGDSDIIMDEDGEGEVYFDKTLLTGGKKEAGSGCEPTEEDGSSVYKGNGGIYTLSGDTLTFEKGGETLTILNFNDERMVA